MTEAHQHQTIPRGNEKLPDLLGEDAQLKNYPWNIGCGVWCRKFFWEGRTVSGDIEYINDVGPLEKFTNKRRRLVAVCLPLIFVHVFWWSVFIKHDLFYLFADKYPLVIIMVFASVLAGLTSIGASSVVFPVLTLIYEVSPKVARDFGMFSQAIGLTCAVCTVFLMKVRVEWNAIIFCGFGGSIGLILGLEVIERLMPPSLKKMIFASFWFSFAFALFFLNRNRERKTFSRIYSMNWWKAIILIICGIVGGIFGSFVGSGIDICSLSILTLFFRLSEKSASPTTLVIIASNSVLGLIWRQGIQSNVSMETWEYTAVSAVVIVVGAPIGSFIGAHFRRQVIAWFIYLLVTLTLITSFVLIPQTPVLIGVSIGVILLGAGMFALLTYFGHILLEKYKRESENCGQNDVIVKQMAQKGNSVTPIAITHL